MSRLVWVSAVLVPVVVVVLGLRWALADFLLDQFGSLPDSLTREEQPEGRHFASDRSDLLPSSSNPEVAER